MMTLHQRVLHYQKTKDVQLRDSLLIDCLEMIKHFAKKNRTMYIHYWQVEDTVSLGIICAVECIENFDQGKSDSFESYLVSRLKFRLIDELRQYGLTPRRVNQTAKIVNNALDKLTQELGRFPSDDELAEFTGMSSSQLSLHYHETTINYLVSMEEMIEKIGDSSFEDKQLLTPQQHFSQEQIREELKQALRVCTKKEQLLIQLYYVEQYKFKEIGYVLDVSEARVSQLHNQALTKMRQYLKEINNE